ncbi:MAG: DNA polymerase III subunit gamma/tau [Coprococcus sp.]
MAYQALYRKWRPSGFDEVRGQDHIVTTLKNQIQMNRIGHAYLFCGTRGTGKTSIAKIFAKAVNCEHPVNGSPCNECAMCRAVNEQRSMNVIEIDAASNNGVDNIREIRDEVAYSPSEGRYKVYIIDEVHMLSIGAFNALLKTLEEPPSYVIFILATTEAHKIPITILSRCQRYDFRRISTGTIAGRLRELADAEGIDAEDAALNYVARMADGSMRDALSLLDQCNAFYIGQKLKYENVLEVLGAVDTSVFGRLLRYVAVQDTTAVIRLVDEIVMQGRELTQFVVDFTWYLRNLLMIQSSGDLTDLVEASEEQLRTMQEEAALVDANTLMRYIRIFSDLSGQVRYSTQKRVLVEVALIKLCQPAMERNLDSLMNRLSILEQKVAQGIVAAPQTAVDVQGDMPGAGGSGADAVKPQQKALSEDIKLIIKRWKQVLEDLSPSMGLMLKGAHISEGPDHQLMIGLADEMRYGYFEDENHRQTLEQALSERAGKEVRVVLVKLQQEAAAGDFIDPVQAFQGIDIIYED